MGLATAVLVILGLLGVASAQGSQVFNVSCSAITDVSSSNITCIATKGSQSIMDILYSINGGSFIPASGFPIVIDNADLDDGPNLVQVRLTSSGGLTAEVFLIIRTPEEGLVFGCNIIDDGDTIEYSCSSNEDVTLQCFVDNEPFDECSLSGSLMLSDYSTESHTLLITAEDDDGNEASFTHIFQGAGQPPPTIDLEVTCTGGGDEDSLNIDCAANKPIASVMCSFDGGEFEQCSFPVEIGYTDVASGLHSLEINITDTDGQYAYIIIPYFFPPVAPDLGLQCGASGDASGVTYNCTLDEEVTSLQCFVDDRPITDCSLPLFLSYADYSVGSHVVTFSFETPAGSTQLESVFYNPGVAPIPLQCDQDYGGTDFSYNCSSDEGVSSVQCLLDGTPYSDCRLSNTLVYSEFPIGLHTLELLVTTSAGNTANMSYIFYTPPEELEIFNCTGRGDEDSLSFTCETNKPNVNVSCLFDDKEFEKCTFPVELPYDCPGLHSLVILVTDNEGQSDYAIIPYFFPAEPPRFGLECEGTGDAHGITFECTLDEEVTTLQCSVDGQPLPDCSLPLFLSHADYSVGSHAVTLSFETAEGSTKSEVVYYNGGVALQPLQCDEDYGQSSFSYNCSSDEGVSSVQCLLNGIPYSNCQQFNTLAYTEFPVGLSTLELLFTTSAGNTANMSYIFYVPPALELSCTGSADEDSLNFDCEANKPIISVSCSFDQGEFKQCTLPVEIAFEDITPGLHSLVIIITDSDCQPGYVIIPFFFPAEAPKFGLQCAGTGDGSGVTYNCTLNEEVTSLQCFRDGQPLTDCSLPLFLSYADHSVGTHAVNLLFETPAGSTEFEAVYYNPGITPQPLQCDQEYNVTAFSYSCSSDEGVSSVQCLLDGVPHSDCQLSNTLVYSEFPIGLHTLELLVTTSAGNTANVSYIFYTPPVPLDITCTGRPDEDSLNFYCEANKPITSVMCSINRGDFESCTFPVKVPFKDLTPGVYGLTIMITDNDGQVGFVRLPYFFPSVAPKFGIQCVGTGGSSGIVFNCTLDEEVTSLQCFVDRQPLADCSLPLFLSHADYSAGVHAVAVLFNTAAGSTTFETVYYNPGVAPQPLQCDVDPGEASLSYSCNSDEEVSSVECLQNGMPYSDCQLSDTFVYSEFPVGLNTLELRVTTSAGNTANVSYVFYNAPALDLYFINNTPELVGGSVSAEFASNRPGLEISCHLTHFDGVNFRQDCSNGTYSRTGIPPGDYTLRVIARDPVRGDRKVIRNRLWVHSDDANDPYCITYLINRGWRVEGRNFTVEFTATGIASGFECALDRMEHIDCASPYTVANLSPGAHHVRVKPRGCGREYRVWNKKFRIV